MNDLPMVPLKVTLHMASPIVARGDMIHLDAILAYARHRRSPQRVREDPSITWEPEHCVPLPLVVMRWGPFKWYRASAVALDGARSQGSWSKKWDKDDEHLLDLGNATQLTLQLGRFKEAHVPLELVFMPRLEFHAVGHRDSVRRLIKLVDSVGPKRSQGYGRIDGFEIERVADPAPDWDRDWRTEDNRPARHLPVGFASLRGLTHQAEKEAPLMPPYWRLQARNVTSVAC